jgi:hypothetical protein
VEEWEELVKDSAAEGEGMRGSEEEGKRAALNGEGAGRCLIAMPLKRLKRGHPTHRYPNFRHTRRNSSHRIRTIQSANSAVPIDSSYGTTDRTLSETNTWERTIGFQALLELDMGCRMAFLYTSMRM